MKKLTGKTAIVTGAARGIGAAVARLFIDEGARVLLTDVLEDEGRAMVDSLGDRARFLVHDVRSSEQWREAVALCEREFGEGVDVLVNNAGIGGDHFELMEDLAEEMARKILDVNVIGTLLGMQSVVPAMERKNGGSIVNISSNTGIRVMNSLSVYGASKWAVLGLSKTASLELGPRQIRVNTIHPGGANTMMGNAGQLPRPVYDKAFNIAPLQRACEPDEIAAGILFFASDESRYCTGAELVIDGGWSTGVYYPALPGGPPKRSKGAD